MKEIILIKLGGSLITDKNKALTAREDVIRRLAEEIKVSRKNYRGRIIIGHGSGSFGHSIASKYQTQDGMINDKSFEGLPLVADAAAKINRIVVRNLLETGIPAVSFSPASFIYSKGKKVSSAYIIPINKALDIGFIPVIYGDIIFDEKIGFCIYSGEKVLNLLAYKLSPKYKIRIIYCGNTDGVYDLKGNTIKEITEKTFINFKKAIIGSESTDVTGGMLHKVEESLDVAEKYKIGTLIINGLEKGNLRKAILGKIKSGTLIKS